MPKKLKPYATAYLIIFFIAFIFYRITEWELLEPVLWSWVVVTGVLSIMAMFFAVGPAVVSWIYELKSIYVNKGDVALVRYVAKICLIIACVLFFLVAISDAPNIQHL